MVPIIARYMAYPGTSTPGSKSYLQPRETQSSPKSCNIVCGRRIVGFMVIGRPNIASISHWRCFSGKLCPLLRHIFHSHGELVRMLYPHHVSSHKRLGTPVLLICDSLYYMLIGSPSMFQSQNYHGHFDRALVGQRRR